MKTESKLSDKRIPINDDRFGNKSFGFYEEDVKEFIKLLKEEMCRCKTMVGEGKKCYACRNIDKLSGDLK